MADKSSFIIPENLSFEEALQVSQALLEGMVEGSLNTAEVQQAIAHLVSSGNGARGFFVVYLSEPRSLADESTSAVIEALKTSPGTISSLLVKNLAMSTAMATAHRRNHNEEQALGSDRVQARTLHLIQHLQTLELKEHAIALCQTLDGTSSSYQSFLERWGYDQEQQQAIRQVLGQTNLLETH
ncbi:MAG: hypothetical protein IGS48_20225 [Oscillatoriales cyanobacterium C42_A2020_001]|nr:hypothetical protein [Leptolyngbyaceae cyanobacterium C42_A2020_001]